MGTDERDEAGKVEVEAELWRNSTFQLSCQRGSTFKQYGTKMIVELGNKKIIWVFHK